MPSSLSVLRSDTVDRGQSEDLGRRLNLCVLLLALKNGLSPQAVFKSSINT